MIYVISDTHFDHAKIEVYCNRPKGWQDLIIRNWKRIVGPGDTVLHLGDLGWKNAERMAAIVKELPGRLIILKGNHDQSARWLERCGATLVLNEHGRGVSIDDPDYPAAFVCAKIDSDPRALLPHFKEWFRSVVVSHEPHTNIKWPYLYGHVHNNPVAWDDAGVPFPLSTIPGRNVCVEVMNYMPVPLPVILADSEWIEKHWGAMARHLFGMDPQQARSKE